MDEMETRKLAEITYRLSNIEEQLNDLQQNANRTRRTVWWTWVYSDIVSPLIAISILLAALYFGVTYIEDQFLDGASLLDLAQKLLGS